MSTNRIVILLSPVFVALAGWVVTLAAKYLPGHPHLDAAQLDAVFIAGALFAAAHVGQWVHGWQKVEARRLPVVSLGGGTTAVGNTAVGSTALWDARGDASKIPGSATTPNVAAGDANAPLPDPPAAS